MNPQHAARRLRPFLAGSIVLHLAVLAAAMRLDLNGVPTISVVLDAELPPIVATRDSSGVGETRQTRTVREAAALGRIDSRPSADTASPDRTDAIAHTVQQGAPDAVAGQAEDSSTQAAAASVELRGRIESDLARFFHYPPLARREGWEGVVQLQFDVAGDGAIENIHVASSSGYALLDRAAQAALTKAAHVAVPPSRAGGARAIALPVHYRLTEPR